MAKFNIPEDEYVVASHKPEAAPKETGTASETVPEPFTMPDTRGRKGQSMPRINMAFRPDIHEYITRESRRRGLSKTEFVNFVLDSYKNGKYAYLPDEEI